MFLIPDCLLHWLSGRDETKDIGKENLIQIYCFIAIQESEPESNHWTLESLKQEPPIWTWRQLWRKVASPLCWLVTEVESLPSWR